MPIRAIFFDVDGTLLTWPDHQLPPSALSALQQLHENGVLCFVASGRPPVHIQEVNRMIPFEFDGYIVLNGQYCMDKNHEVYRRHGYTQEQLSQMVEWLKDNPDVNCMLIEENTVHQTTSLRTGIPVIDPEEILGREIFQCTMNLPMGREDEVHQAVDGVKYARWNPNFCDFIPADGGKEIGIQATLDHYGITREECMAVGDGHNDITMCQYCQIGVAMGNAHEPLKAIADYITDDISQNGLAKAMIHFGLIEHF